MAQKIRNNQKKYSNNSQNIKKKAQTKDIPETPAKKNGSSLQPISSYLSPLPIPPKLDSSNHYVFGSNYSYSSEIQQIYTPIVKQHPRFMPIQEQPTIIMNRIIFQSEDQDGQNNSSQLSSEEQDQLTPNSSSQPSGPSQSEPSNSEQQSSGQPSQDHGNTMEKEVKIRNRPSKSRTGANQSKQTNPNKKVFCNCKKTKCLKLYCDCFRLNQTCEGCNCVGCHNLQVYNEERNNAILSLMDRNPDPFGQKIEADKHLKGCNCKKSNCLKKYCQCYQAGLKCGQNCKCEECKNIVIEKGPEGQKGGALSKNTAKKQKKMVEI